jgi:hypothetical protein
MKLLKIKNKLQFAKLLIAPCLLATILTGCSQIAVKTVKVNDFCDRYEPLWLVKSDFEAINNIRKYPTYRLTIDKYIDFHAINEKEHQSCLYK